MKLQVLICTFGRRIEEIDPSGMPQVDGVGYLVCCQNPEGLHLETAAERLASRPDTDVLFFNDRGLSNNRNHAFDHATAPYLLISDDDISYTPDGLQALIEAFDADPTLDIVTSHASIPEKHIYPPDGHDLQQRYRFYSPISFEIALRRSAIENKGLRFSPLAGIGGAYLTAGEENFFLLRALRTGLKGRFIDRTVSTHRGLTTCEHSATKAGTIRAKGALITADRGIAGALIRFPLEAVRSTAPTCRAFANLLQGFVYYLKNREKL